MLSRYQEGHQSFKQTFDYKQREVLQWWAHSYNFNKFSFIFFILYPIIFAFLASSCHHWSTTMHHANATSCVTCASLCDCSCSPLTILYTACTIRPALHIRWTDGNGCTSYEISEWLWNFSISFNKIMKVSSVALEAGQVEEVWGLVPIDHGHQFHIIYLDTIWAYSRTCKYNFGHEELRFLCREG